MLKLMRFYFKWLSMLTPGLSSSLAIKIFYTPQKSKQSPAELESEQAGQKCFFPTSQGKLKTIFWQGEQKSSKTVLLAHGWGGRGTQLYRFIKPLLKYYNIVTFDGPAHGESPGKVTTLPKYALALAEICKEFKVSHVIAHSFGGAAVGVAIAKYAARIERIALISPPLSVENVVNNFCRHLSIPSKLAEKIHKKMENRKWHNKIRTDFSFMTLGPQIKNPVLIFHSRDDQYVHYADGKLTSEYLLDAELVTLDGLGHYRPISNSKVIAKTIEFIIEQH
jgi:pimeloyl-ACP methyl ester carboxylesterase